MNRRPRYPQRQAPPLRGRAATLSVLNPSTFAPLSARPITRQPPPSGRLRPSGRLGQPYSNSQAHSNGQSEPDAQDHRCHEPSESLQPQKPVLQWVDWIRRWGWFVAVALVIMAIAIGSRR